ncbi:hypothetical protein AB9F45_37320, partial [Rhizobium leguminosarum]|uniref:hypothetical protein n=1 Tax=Rhizobium leguminosarum TaxID=384 RepID=UPI003F98A847
RKSSSRCAIVALVNLALPEAATQSATSTLFVFNEAIVAWEEAEGGSERRLQCGERHQTQRRPYRCPFSV